MNYFNRNRLITIFLIAFMVINIAALVTIAAKTRIFSGRNRPPVETQKDQEQISNSEKEKRFAESMSKKLALSEKQEEEMKKLWEDNKEKMKPVMALMSETRMKLNEEMGSRELDLDRIQALNDTVAFLDKQIRENLLEYNIKVRELLDDEQLEKYLEMHKNMRKRGGNRRSVPLDIIQIF